MKKKVFGVGLNRTGTSTLGRCFEIMGYKHTTHHTELLKEFSSGNLKPIFKYADTFESFDTWPWSLMYQELDKYYAGSKFVLTTRKNSAVWYQSLCKHAERTGPTIERRLVYGYDMPQDYKKEHIQFYERHNEAVREYFKDRDDDFIELSWENGSSWDDLCSFLNEPIPDQEFPHAAKSYSPARLFLSHWKNRLFGK